mmetsp:Transcript_71507/g.160127  ORF Transcript_71507/g.160127 Transcript_71507/m.160127 type:complete len:215 (+) Transcript_71507:258-902(+)
MRSSKARRRDANCSETSLPRPLPLSLRALRSCSSSRKSLRDSSCAGPLRLRFATTSFASFNSALSWRTSCCTLSKPTPPFVMDSSFTCSSSFRSVATVFSAASLICPPNSSSCFENRPCASPWAWTSASSASKRRAADSCLERPSLKVCNSSSETAGCDWGAFWLFALPSSSVRATMRLESSLVLASKRCPFSSCLETQSFNALSSCSEAATRA